MVKLAYLKHADQLVVGNRELQERGQKEAQVTLYFTFSRHW